MKTINATPTLRKVALSELKPAPYNPRKIDMGALAGLEKSLQKFGVLEPIIWNERTGHVIGGHQRLQILEKAQTSETIVVVVNLSEKDEKAANIALNSPIIAGEFTQDLDALLDEIAQADAQLFEDLQLGGLFQIDEEATDPVGEWIDMPEFSNPDALGFRSIVVHFMDQDAVDQFSVLIQQDLGKKRAIFFPEAEVGHIAKARYVKSKS